MASRSTAGFTLLEAIVALTVMALALIPLVSFIAQSSDQLMRAGAANEQSMVTQSVLALMDPVNPMAEPEGTLALDETISISWRADVIAPPPEGSLVRTPLSGFRIGFYGVTVSVMRNELPWFEFRMRKVGYQNLRQGSAPDILGGAP